MNTQSGQGSITGPGDSRNSGRGMRRARPLRYLSRISYPRHLAGLILAAAALLAARHWYPSRDALLSVVVYSLLYSSVTAFSLRAPHSLVRKALFILVAAVLGGASFSVSLYGGRWLGWSSPAEYLLVCAAIGAIAYVLLLQRLFMESLSQRALLLLPLASVLAVAAVFLSGIYSQHVDALALVWWFAISAGLWCEEYRNALTAGIH